LGAASAEVAPELLAKQNRDISLIVNRENKQAQAPPPDLAAEGWGGLGWGGKSRLPRAIRAA
jgi:hypothetical protein